MKSNASLFAVIFILTFVFCLVDCSEKSEDEVSVKNTNLPQEELVKTDQNAIDLKTRSSREWFPIPVMECRKSEKYDNLHVKIRYVVTLENGLMIGSDKYYKKGDTSFCWINSWHSSSNEDFLDSIVFKNPHIKNEKND
jgi:hypothetical protein